MAQSPIETEEIKPAGPLPKNKSFHVYFLSVSQDKEKVISLSHKLERFGYRCCYHDKDSVAGKLVIDNFWELLHKSMKVVLILSKAFVDSCWCKYEVDITLSLCMERKLRVIPLVIDDCEVPQEIRLYMHHLNISGPEVEWRSRFFGSIEEDMDDLYRQFENMSLDDSYTSGMVQKGECGPWESLKLPCVRYDTGRLCYQLDYPHVCRDFIIYNACNGDNCQLSHDILNERSEPLLQKMGFDLSKPRDQLVDAYRKACIEMLRLLPKSRVTGPCSYYNNSNRVCLDSSNGKLCPFPHICIRWFQGKCKFTQETCPFAHDLSDPNVLRLLELFKIDPSLPEDEILRSYRAKYGRQQT